MTRFSQRGPSRFWLAMGLYMGSVVALTHYGLGSARSSTPQGEAVVALLAILLGFVAVGVQRLERLSARLEALAMRDDGPAGAGPTADVRAARIRWTIENQEWAQAETLLLADGIDLDQATTLRDELKVAKQKQATRLRRALDAARGVNDPERVLELQAEVKPLLDPAEAESLDADLARWLSTLIQRKLRLGSIPPDVLALADRVADRFEHTADGASLRASLPVLRRAAGLCGACGAPYKGVSKTCPKCSEASKTTTGVDARGDSPG